MYFDERQFYQFPQTPPPGAGPGAGPGGMPGGMYPGFPPGQPPGAGVPYPGGGGQPGAGSPPTTPPPSFTPQLTQAQATGGEAGVFAVDPGSIRRCLYRFTYIWLDNYRSFWFYPTFLGRRSIAGYRWNGFRWVYFGTDLRRIRSFQCF